MKKKNKAVISWILTLSLCSLGLNLAGCAAPTRKVNYQPAPSQPVVTTAQETPPSSAPAGAQGGVSETSTLQSIDAVPGSPFAGLPDSPELQNLKQDFSYVEKRLAVYEKKFQKWLEQNNTEITKDENYINPMTWDGCMDRFERLLNGYTRLRNRMLQELSSQGQTDKNITAGALLAMDIDFLESDCEKLMRYDSSSSARGQAGDTDKINASVQTEALINQYFQEEKYDEAISAHQYFSSTYPDSELSMLSTIQYGSSLLHTGKIAAATAVFQKLQNVLSAISQAIKPWSLHRRTADLFLVTGNLVEAKRRYEALINSYDSMQNENSWALVQLSILDEYGPEDQKLTNYIDLLRAYLIFDSTKHNSLELLQQADRLIQASQNSILAEGAIQMKLAIEKQLQDKTYKQLNLVDQLVEEKNFQQALTLLRKLSPNNLPSELKDIVLEKLDDVLQAETEELEAQRVLFKQTLADQWETAVSLLDSENYDAAIEGFESLLETDYDAEARSKIAAAANLAATAKRKQAATLFIRAVKTDNPEQKKELLINSRHLLQEILTNYPQVDLIDKVVQNLETLEEHIRQFDPQLLEDTDGNMTEDSFKEKQVEPPEKMGGQIIEETL